MEYTTRIQTDTASLCLFDPKCLRHRLTDNCDWWSDTSETLREINAGNALIVGLGSDGFYDITLRGREAPEADFGCHANLLCKSGRLYIGSSEDLTGGGLEPNGTTGYFYDAPIGTCRVSIVKVSAYALSVFVQASSATPTNQFHDEPTLYA